MNKPGTQRLQGTDGIRRETKLSNDSECKGLTPQQVFLEKGWITEQFMELYAYSYIKNLSELKAPKNVVVGWDPRDPSGIFIEAVIKGIRKAGGNVLALGIVPTPLVPLFMLHQNADCGVMITASHNPNDQNGIKLFSPFHGMKPLPSDDAQLTRFILPQKYSSIKSASLKGKRKDCRENALELFNAFTLASENSWVDESINFKSVVLVVDPANGSLTGIAKKIFTQAGFGKVFEVNGKVNGNVNVFSGVADLEGRDRITAVQIKKTGGYFYRHKAVVKLFEVGRKYKSSLRKGIMRAVGTIFDADADRFFMLEYDPFKDLLWVLSGDETAILQAKHLSARFPEKYKGSLYINTVESDLNAATAAEKMGLKAELTAVGDKWILLKILLKQLEQKAKDSDCPKQKRLVFQRETKKLKKTGITSISSLKKLAKILGEKKVQKKDVNPVLAVGSEETGHNITESKFTRPNGEVESIYSGNGIKSALNTLVATEYLNLSPEKYYKKVSRPFIPGFKGTLYVYYIHQELFFSGSIVWRKVKQTLIRAAKKRNYKVATRIFPEDPDMLYISLSAGKAGIFVRNSGTENKISINLRGSKSDAASLKQIGQETVRILFTALKNCDHHFYKLELNALSQIASQQLNEKDLDIAKNSKTRLVMEVQKQGLIEMSSKGFRLTELGKWYVGN
jgi:phosphoglucosamine mutase